MHPAVYVHEASCHHQGISTSVLFMWASGLCSCCRPMQHSYALWCLWHPLMEHTCRSQQSASTGGTFHYSRSSMVSPPLASGCSFAGISLTHYHHHPLLTGAAEPMCSPCLSGLALGITYIHPKLSLGSYPLVLAVLLYVTVYNKLLIESHFSSFVTACCLNIRSYFCYPWPQHLPASLSINV